MKDAGAGQDAAATFEPLRPRLVRVAYRMLGSLTDAEDVAQDAYLRWQATDRAAVRDPQAYLSRTVTRLCLDMLKSARRWREDYVGPWLPEPVFEEAGDEIDEDITIPLMLALDRLSPLERAAFLLHDVFGMGFGEVAETIGRDEAACRQLASRARVHVRTARPRFPVGKARGLEIATAFFTASRAGDLQALSSMLAADVLAHSDGGGKKPAAMRVLDGLEDVMRLHTGLARMYAQSPSRLIRYGFVNGMPGFVTVERDETLQTTALLIEDDRIAAIYIVRNPDKLRAIRAS